MTGTGTASQASRVIWPPSWWPVADRVAWDLARAGKGPSGHDNPACIWRDRTLKKHVDAYGRYLSWLDRQNLLCATEAPEQRITPERINDYVRFVQASLAPVSVGTVVGSLAACAKAFAPDTDWTWLRRRYTRLKLRAAPSREKRHIVQHTLDLYRFGKELMEEASRRPAGELAAAQRYQAGLIIALLAARPLRIRNFQAITIGESLRWDGSRYWLTFSADDTKTGNAIDEPLPADLVPHLEGFLRTWRPILTRRAGVSPGKAPHRRLWVAREGYPMKEAALRTLIERYTKQRFGTAIWPHLFRHCLLTSVAIDQPDLMRISAALLSHTNYRAGDKHYNQARMLDASRRFAETVSGLREGFLDGLRSQQRKGER